ncbi:MAG: hypothetical protein Q4D40_01965 [Eubacteriales bacterium]|nr:hypothetical protein [Eubacteriales bacterium]
MDIVITGFAGLEGSLSIYNCTEYREKLLNRYSKSFFRVFEKPDSIYNDMQTLDRLFKKEVAAGRAAAAGRGGVLAGLWEIMKENRLGGTYSQKDIPILQQTVEICEVFFLNPYRLWSPGCRIWLTEDTGSVMAAAEESGVPAAVIGYTGRMVKIRRTDIDVESSLRKPEGEELDRLGLT